MENIQLRIIAEIIAKKSNTSPEYMFQKSRKRDVADMRATFFYFAKRYSILSLEKIGAFSSEMGRCEPHDHATVLYNIRKVKNLKSIDKEFSDYIDELDKEIMFNVDYERYWYDEKTSYRKSIIQPIHMEEDLDFLSKFSGLTTIIYENKEFLSKLADVAQRELTIKKERIEDERLHQTTQEDIRLGMV